MQKSNVSHCFVGAEFWNQPTWLIEQAYCELIENEQREQNLKSWAIAVAAFDIVTCLVGKNDEINIERYLPWKIEKPTEIPISKEAAKLFLALLERKEIPRKFLGAIAEHLEDIKAIAER